MRSPDFISLNDSDDNVSGFRRLLLNKALSLFTVAAAIPQTPPRRRDERRSRLRALQATKHRTRRCEARNRRAQGANRRRVVSSHRRSSSGVDRVDKRRVGASLFLAVSSWQIRGWHFG